MNEHKLALVGEAFALNPTEELTAMEKHLVTLDAKAKRAEAHELIENAGDWIDTPEGDGYWDRVYHGLHDTACLIDAAKAKQARIEASQPKVTTLSLERDECGDIKLMASKPSGDKFSIFAIDGDSKRIIFHHIFQDDRDALPLRLSGGEVDRI